MKYYYGNSYKEAISNKPAEITSDKVLAQYEENYSFVIPANAIDSDDWDIDLDEDSYELDEVTGTLTIYKEVFDDFEEDAAIRIMFSDEDDVIREYKMVREDEDNIYCEYLGE